MRQLDLQDKSTPNKTKIAQFGEGNFLRAFTVQMVDIANEQGIFDGGVAIIKPIQFGSFELFEKQKSAYTVILRGLVGGEKVIESRIVSAITQTIDPYKDYESYLKLAKNADLRIVVSNTTEAGIIFDESDKFDQTPANSFPGKLTQFLYARYIHFGGTADCGLIILPVELIESNGTKLHDCVKKFMSLWKLPKSFAAWVEENCIFCNTLVDRIVSGYPTDEAEALERDLLGYRDELMVVGEPFGLWVIESPRREEVQKAFPLDLAKMPVVFTDNLRPYRERKVRILNGAHTASVLAAYHVGVDIVSEAMADKTIRAFMEKAVYEEICPTVLLPAEEVRAFSDSVMERFENPFIRHPLLSIALNSVSKWKTRVLPSLKDRFTATDALPPCLTFSMSALAMFYRSDKRGDGCLIGKRKEQSYEIRDDALILDFFEEHSAKPTEDYIQALLQNTAFWGEDLSKLGEMTAIVTKHCKDIEQIGMRRAIETLL